MSPQTCANCGSNSVKYIAKTPLCMVCGSPLGPKLTEPDLKDEPCPNGKYGSCKGYLVPMDGYPTNRRWQCNRCLAMWAYTPLGDVAQVVPSQAADEYVQSILSGPTAPEPA